MENAYFNNLKDYKETIPHLFWYNAFVILSNGSESKIGTISSEWEHFNEWKKINSEGEKGIVSLDTILKGVCEKQRFLDILENFILYQNTGGSLIKLIAKNHQYLGVNNAIESFKKIKENQGKLGVFWHTQGSGKSFSMIFFSQKILRKFKGNYTFVIVTDRKSLDDQIYKNFDSVGAVTEKDVHAKNSWHLRQLLREDHRNIFTIIHKFRTENGEMHPVLSERSDIIVLTDESHRTQYDTLALNMRNALPNAAFIAFTGTPLIDGEELTKHTFGDYISIYNFKQSIDDGATVPLYYENRIPEVELTNENLNEDMEKIIEDAMLDSQQEKRLEREFARQYHLITRDDRLEKIAEDIVEHFINRGYNGKAMVVAIDKPTTVKMYDKVKKYWNKQIEELQTKLRKARDDKERENNLKSLNYLQETDMAVVVSSEQNEEERFQKLGLNIKYHRKRMVKEDLATKFKDPDDPFRIVFVCAMWMTGFDVQCLSTIYLDKPMKNHTLMQTIARANRVFGEKPNGLIVDYVGIFRSLQKALAIYGTDPTGKIKEGEKPVKPKDELIDELKKAIDEMKSFCKEKGFDLNKIERAKSFRRIELMDDAVDHILVNDKSKENFLALSYKINKLFSAILPDKRASEFLKTIILTKTLKEKIINIISNSVADISEVMQEIESLLDISIASKGYIIGSKRKKPVIDLSILDFETLKDKFLKSNRKRTITEKLKNFLKNKLTKMVQQNRLRINFVEKFQKLIDEYNAGAINVEIFFQKLVEFSKKLNEEEKRSISENLTEEELAIFDLLYKHSLAKEEKIRVKKASKDLLRILIKEKLVIDWRKKQQTRASVLLTIQNIINDNLSAIYKKQFIGLICQKVYQHIYDSYYGSGRSIYNQIAQK